MKITKLVKERIKNIISWSFLCSTGLRKVNGCWSEVNKINKIIEDGDQLLVSGYVSYGVQDMGNGNSSENIDKFKNFPIKKEKLTR